MSPIAASSNRVPFTVTVSLLINDILRFRLLGRLLRCSDLSSCISLFIRLSCTSKAASIPLSERTLSVILEHSNATAAASKWRNYAERTKKKRRAVKMSPFLFFVLFVSFIGLLVGKAPRRQNDDRDRQE